MARKFIEAAAATDPGKVRQYNEDCLAVDPELGVFVVADGMGGHRAGEVASAMAAQIVLVGLRERLPKLGSGTNSHSPLLAVEESINQANLAIWGAAQGHARQLGMGTTLALALFHDNQIVIGHIGDSRVYRLRGGGLQLMTRDDSLLRDEVDAGLISVAEAGKSHNRSLVTQALGVAERAVAHVRRVDAEPGDIVLLCSDGLSDLVEDADIELILQALGANPSLAAQLLVQTAKDNGGYDNITAIVARVRKPFPAARGWRRRLLGWQH
ncbi:MAG TPA: protein phosphatase 2C domain-containing protein [Casimicrobiaceae bacterium]|jgi:protein phosphatase|nr:protein phosphatase 2C domain-containing protein [Casimicrobiaceae bacterium]